MVKKKSKDIIFKKWQATCILDYVNRKYFDILLYRIFLQIEQSAKICIELF